MNTNTAEDTFKDSVNDTIDVTLAKPLRALGHVLLPVVCIALVFGMNALGLFKVVFPDADWGLLSMIGLLTWGSLLVVKAFLSDPPECSCC